MFNGSLLTNERLMEAREFYAPFSRALPAEVQFAKWTARVATQAKLESAREMAGLSDEELRNLEAEFLRSPTRRRSDCMRHAVPAGGVIGLFGGLLLVTKPLAALIGLSLPAALELAGLGTLACGFMVLGAGILRAFSFVHLEMSHGTTGLYVGVLDEQHPWLYKTLALTHDLLADEHRQQVVRDRGPLRGVDYLIMREIARTYQSLEQTRSARSVAELVQKHAATNNNGQAKQEPRLVRFPSQ